MDLLSMPIRLLGTAREMSRDVVHEKPDDGGQPVGNAGKRIGCGVLALAK